MKFVKVLFSNNAFHFILKFMTNLQFFKFKLYEKFLISE